MTPEVVAKVFVMALGALWNVRKHRGAHARTTAIVDSPPHHVLTVSPEMFILAHILDLFRALMKVGISEMTEEDKSISDSERDVNLAQSITATFRRTLPALRIASKWLNENLDYVQKHSSARTPSAEIPSPTQYSDVAETIRQFWIVYAAFATQISTSFPPRLLPELTAPLEEDIDMRGFAPLTSSNSQSELASLDKPAELLTSPSQVHPNEEHLMRIGDLYKDAVRLTKPEVKPSLFHGLPHTYILKFPEIAFAPDKHRRVYRDDTRLCFGFFHAIPPTLRLGSNRQNAHREPSRRCRRRQRNSQHSHRGRSSQPRNARHPRPRR